MKREYDFSGALRGKFFRKGAQLRLPIYLDVKLQSRVEKLARKKHCEVSDVVNVLVQKEVSLLQEYL